MFSKVFLVCAFAFCIAQAHKDFSGEEHDKTNQIFAFQKSFVKYPYNHDYKYDEKYERQDRNYPYYNQHFYQHPFLNQDMRKYYTHETPYVHGQEYNHGINYPYQHWQRQNVEDKYNHYGSFYPYHHDYQGYYYPQKVGGYQCQGLECLTRHHQDYQQEYVHPLLNRFYGSGYRHYPLYEV